MSNIKQWIEFGLSLPKTLFFNLKVFDFKTAIKFPVLVHYRSRIQEVHKGSILLNCNMRGGVKIGFGGTDGIIQASSRNYIQIGKNGKIIINGKTSFSRGTTLRVDGELNLGRNVWFNCNTLISVHEKVVIDNDFVSGWNLLIMDSDNHKVYCDNKLQVDHAPIVIHEKVWAAANVSILKGVSVGTGSIVAYGSIVTSNCLEEYCLYAGIPARKKKSNISWDI